MPRLQFSLGAVFFGMAMVAVACWAYLALRPVPILSETLLSNNRIRVHLDHPNAEWATYNPATGFVFIEWKTPEGTESFICEFPANHTRWRDDVRKTVRLAEKWYGPQLDLRDPSP